MTEAIEFVEWVAQHHFRLFNVAQGTCYWVFEDPDYTTYCTTQELWKRFQRDRDA